MFITDIPQQVLKLEDKIIGKKEIFNLPMDKLISKPEHIPVINFLKAWFSDTDTICVETSGSTGKPKKIALSKSKMIISAIQTCKALNLNQNHNCLLCMNCKHIGAIMMIVRALTANMHLYAINPSRTPITDFYSNKDFQNIRLDFVAMVNMQIFNELQLNKEQLKEIGCLLMGGSRIEENIEKELSCFPRPVFSSYGMTETISHIALRRINGNNKNSSYTPLPNVKISSDASERLIIDYPQILDNPLITNDIVKIHKDGSFDIIGRFDNIINSGGIKINPEIIEEVVLKLLNIKTMATYTPDESLGNAIVLLCERIPDNKEKALIKQNLPQYYFPKLFIECSPLPTTENGKNDRKKAQEIARNILSSKADTSK